MRSLSSPHPRNGCCPLNRIASEVRSRPRVASPKGSSPSSNVLPRTSHRLGSWISKHGSKAVDASPEPRQKGVKMLVDRARVRFLGPQRPEVASRTGGRSLAALALRLGLIGFDADDCRDLGRGEPIAFDRELNALTDLHLSRIRVGGMAHRPVG